MAFAMAIILFVIGYALIHKQDPNMTPAEKAEIRNYESHSADYEREYLLVWGVYAYYAKQGPSVRHQPYQDAVRHARLEMMHRGRRTTATLWYDFKDITPDVESSLNFMWHYTSPPAFASERERVEKWPFKNAPCANHADSFLGPHVSYWSSQRCENDKQRDDLRRMYHGGYLFNRLAEWYYLVMFKDEYLSLRLDIKDALMREDTIPQGYRLSEKIVDDEWDTLLSEIQSVVHWGDKWDAEIHEYQRQAKQKADEERRKAEAPGEERRRKLLESTNSDVDVSAAHTPEWAKQQLKEKYNIDYEN